MSILIASADRLDRRGRLVPGRRSVLGWKLAPPPPPPPPFGTAFTPTLVWGKPPFDPATLNLTGWWRAGDYTPATGIWLGTASAGISGNASQATTSGSAKAGLVLNGHTTVWFDGPSNEQLNIAGAAATDFVSTTPQWSYSALIQYISVPALGNPWTNPSPLGDNAFGFQVGAGTSGGITVVQTEDDNGGFGAVTNYDATVGNWIGVQARSNAASMDVRTILGGLAGAWVSKAAPTSLTGLGTQMLMGKASGRFLNAYVADHLVSKTRFDDATMDLIWQSYYFNRYGGLP